MFLYFVVCIKEKTSSHFKEQASFEIDLCSHI